jgi:hypothetical protein
MRDVVVRKEDLFGKYGPMLLLALLWTDSLILAVMILLHGRRDAASIPCREPKAILGSDHHSLCNHG